MFPVTSSIATWHVGPTLLPRIRLPTRLATCFRRRMRPSPCWSLQLSRRVLATRLVLHGSTMDTETLYFGQNNILHVFFSNSLCFSVLRQRQAKYPLCQHKKRQPNATRIVQCVLSISYCTGFPQVRPWCGELLFKNSWFERLVAKKALVGMTFWDACM